jgi:hypothetical protein
MMNLFSLIGSTHSPTHNPPQRTTPHAREPENGSQRFIGSLEGSFLRARGTNRATFGASVLGWLAGHIRVGARFFPWTG